MKYDPDTHILTLNGATITVPIKDNTSDKSQVAGIHYESEEELIIVTIGSNTVTGAHYNSGYGKYIGKSIYTMGSLTLRGTGILNVKLDTTRTDAHYNYGIYCREGLTIESGTVNVEIPQKSFENKGIHSDYGNFTMTGGNVTINIGDAEATDTFSAVTEGICANTCTISGGSLKIISGSVKAQGNSYQLTYGIRGSYIYISGGTVDLKAGNVLTVNTNTFAQGICSGRELEISGGTVTTDGGTCTEGMGIEARGYLKITGGMVTAKGGKYAISANYSDYSDRVTIDDGLTKKACSDYAGAMVVTYNPNNLDTYKYIETTPPAYKLWVGGVQVTYENASNITGGNIISGKVSYDAGTNTLTLDNATITGLAGVSDASGAGICFKDNKTLTIVQKGTNKVTGVKNSESSTYGYAIYANHLKMKGDGTLTASFEAKDVASNYAIYTRSFIMDEGTVIAKSGTPTSGSPKSEAIHAHTESVTINGGRLTARSGACKNSSAIYAYQNITIEDGIITAEAPASSSDTTRVGMTADKGKITIKGGSVKAIGTKAMNKVPVMTGYSGWQAKAYATEKAETYTKYHSGNLMPDTLFDSTACQYIVVEPENYDLWVGGVLVTPANCPNIEGASIKGSVSYDPAARVLKLNNVQITGVKNDEYTRGAGIYSDITDDIKIEFAGENTVNGVGYDYGATYIGCIGIKTKAGLTLGSDTDPQGTLRITAGSAGATYTGGCYGISCGGKLDMISGTVVAIGGDTASKQFKCGIETGSLHVNGGNLTVLSGDADSENSYGIKTKSGGDKITISGGALSVAAGKLVNGDSKTSIGIFVDGASNIKITDGTFVSKGYTCAVYSDFTINYSSYTGVSPKASTVYDGTGATENNLSSISDLKYIRIGSSEATGYNLYKEADIGTYKYLQIAEDPAYHVHHPVEMPGKEPTCTEAGIKTFYICDCGFYEDDACTRKITEPLGAWKVIPALGHKEIMEFDETHHWKVCVRCGEKTSAEEAHVFDGEKDKDCNKCTFTRGLSISIAEDLTDCTYTGDAIRPAIIVRSFAKVLTEGVDYTVTYKNNVNASADAKPNKKPVIIVKGKGNYAGTTQKTFEIAKRSLADVTAGSLVVVKGSKAAPVLLYNGNKLSAKDYTNPDAAKKFAESGSITVTGKGNYRDSITIPVKVVASRADLKTFKAALGTEKPVYDGTEKKISYTVQDKATKAELTKGVDYEVFYTGDTVNAGTVKVSFVGLGAYTGSDVKKYTIKPCKAAAGSMKVTGVKETGYTYQPAGAGPGGDLKVTYASGSGDVVLTAGRDYTVACSGNKKVGDKAKYTVKFTGNYKGTKAVTGTYKITPAPLDNTTDGLKISVADQVYAGKPGAYLSKPVVSVGGILLKAADYTVNYYLDAALTKEIKGKENPVTLTGDTPVKVYVKITGRGSFGADSTKYATADYQVCSAKDVTNLGKAKISFRDQDGKEAKKFAYTGREIEPEVVVQVKDGSTWKTIENTKYTAEYHNNLYKGKATVIVKANAAGIAGGKSASFSIVSKDVSKIAELWKNLFK